MPNEPDDTHFHPIANIFPLLDGAAYEELVEDIRTNGLLEPIWRDRGGLIIDGRNRWRACQAAGVECRSETFLGNDDELLRFVISKNLARRHLDTSQRAMIAARLATLRDGQRKSASPIGEAATQGEAAESLNVGKRSVERARVVLEHGTPELVAAVDGGQISVSKAAGIAKAERASQQCAVVDDEPVPAPGRASRRRANRADDIHCEDLTPPLMTEEQFNLHHVLTFLSTMLPPLSPQQAFRATPDDRHAELTQRAGRLHKWLNEYLCLLNGEPG